MGSIGVDRVQVRVNLKQKCGSKLSPFRAIVCFLSPGAPPNIFCYIMVQSGYMAIQSGHMAVQSGSMGVQSGYMSV